MEQWTIVAAGSLGGAAWRVAGAPPLTSYDLLWRATSQHCATFRPGPTYVQVEWRLSGGTGAGGGAMRQRQRRGPADGSDGSVGTAVPEVRKVDAAGRLRHWFDPSTWRSQPGSKALQGGVEAHFHDGGPGRYEQRLAAVKPGDGATRCGAVHPMRRRPPDAAPPTAERRPARAGPRPRESALEFKLQRIGCSWFGPARRTPARTSLHGRADCRRRPFASPGR